MSKMFSERFQMTREECGITQQELADRFKLGRSTISGYERMGKEPPYDLLCELADLFKVSTDYLLGRTKKRTNTKDVFPNDQHDFKSAFESAPDDTVAQAEKCFASFYELIGYDTRNANDEHLELYASLLHLVAVKRAQIARSIRMSGGSISDPLILSDIMAAQSDLKNEISVLLDKLTQADMEAAFQLKAKETAENTGA